MVQNKNILTLDRISKKDKSESAKEVTDVLLLMQTNEKAEEIEMLKKIGLDTHIRQAERVQQNIQRFTVLEQKFGRNVYSAAQVKAYCESNAYKVIRVDKFKHEVPVVVGEEIIKFAKEHTSTHKRNEDSTIERVNINLQTSHFFLLTSIQSINGAPVKAATLFYREEYHHDWWDKLREEDMLIEVHSWGVPGNERSLFWDYTKATDYFMLFPLVFILIGILMVILGNNHHGGLLFCSLISVISILLINKKSFWKWNSN